MESRSISTTRDADFWFADGNIVLIAPPTLFSVHTGVLARNSSVFCDLFTIPTPQNDERIDGCPVLHLSDSAHDVRCFLRALYDGRNFLRADKQLTFSEVAALIRMSHKYQIADLLHDAVARLKTCFPHRFEDFDRSIAKGNLSSPVMTFDTGDAISAVNLARLTQTSSILPVALYLCCQLDPAVLTTGVERADGIREQLCEGDLVRCLRGALYLSQANTISNFNCFKTEVSAACMNPPECGLDIAFLLAFCEDFDIPPCFDVLSCVGSTLDIFNEEEILLCAECVRCVIERRTKDRQRVWKSLPSSMGVEVDDWSL